MPSFCSRGKQCDHAINKHQLIGGVLSADRKMPHLEHGARTKYWDVNMYLKQ